MPVKPAPMKRITTRTVEGHRGEGKYTAMIGPDGVLLCPDGVKPANREDYTVRGSWSDLYFLLLGYGADRKPQRTLRQARTLVRGRIK